ncbi:MAG: hypothetical protein WBN90_06705 [Gammaproteobacteria bacterium]
MLKDTIQRKTNRSPMQFFRSLLTGICMVLPLMLISPSETLAAPVAGSVIGNQASATYLDGSGQARTATSNLVETVVAQVGGVDIESDLSKSTSVGGTVNYPHTISNSGNGVDTFSLAVVDADSGNIALGSLVIYADADQDGVPDNFTPITVTPGMNPGDSYGIVVATTVPGSAVAGDAESMTVTATSQFDAAVSDAVTDTVTVTGNAVMEVTKAINVTSGPSPNGNPADPDDPITVTLTYTNRGIGTATAVTITDTLPAGMSYVADSGLWSGSVTALDDASGANDPAGIDYDGADTSPNEVVAIIASVPQGQSGSVSFEITVDSGLVPGAIGNIANYSYNDGAGVIPPVDTNTASYTVQSSAGVELTDNGSNTDDDAANDDVLISGPVAQGSTLLFDNVLVNNGNGSDTFDIQLSGSTYPPGTTFQLFQADASGNPISPMTDSNGNGIPDSGPLAPGASYHAVLQATLPTNASGGPFSITATATSYADPAVTNTVTDTVTEVEDMIMDMTNDPASVDVPGTIGTGAGPEGTAVTTVSVDPGSSAIFTLDLKNESLLSGDTYDLDASTDPAFAAVSLPPGWSVVFRDAGNAVINSLTVPANTTSSITAEITVPANASPSAGTGIFFRAGSSTSGAGDILHDAVVVNTVHDLSIASDSNGQVSPGGSVEYPFTLTNDGNVAETTASLSVANGNALWISTPQIYHDRNGNGVIDAGEPIVADLADVLADGGAAGGASTDLDPGESVNLVARVEAPASAGDGDTNDTTVTVAVPLDSDPGNDSLTNISTVVSGDVSLAKAQGLDVNCDGDLLDAGDVAFTTGQINTSAAAPGACILYRVTATNTGSSAVSSLVVSDPTPPFTTYGCDSVSPQVVNNCAASGTGAVTAPALGSTGVIADTVGPLAPAAASTLTFGVKIDP